MRAGLSPVVSRRDRHGSLRFVVPCDLIEATARTAFAIVQASDVKVVLLALLLTPLIAVDVGLLEGSSAAVYARGIVAGRLAASIPSLAIGIAVHRSFERFETARAASADLLDRAPTPVEREPKKTPRPGTAWNG